MVISPVAMNHSNLWPLILLHKMTTDYAFSKARPIVAGYLALGSVGYFALSHSFQPPWRTLTFLNPISINCRPTRELVASPGQPQ
jgi:hypothetical protein